MPTHSIRKPFTAFFFALIAVVCLGTGCTPSGPKALLQGEQLIRKGKHAAAIAKLRIATELMRNEPRAWNYLGLAYHGAGQVGEAVMAYQKAQQLDQNLAAARYNLGELYLEQGNAVSAVEELSAFTALEPKFVAGWVRLGDAHLQNRRLDRAQNSYVTAINLQRETPAAFNGLGLILFQRKNPRDAYKYFVEATKYDPNYAPAILNMAVVAHTQLNVLPTALARYKDYLVKAPAATNAAAVRGVIRQLESELNPAPIARHDMVVAGNPNQKSAPTNLNLTARTGTFGGKPTNLASPTPTNVVTLTAASTNVSASTNVLTASRPEMRGAKPVGPTNQQPVQVAATEVATKPAAATASPTSAPLANVNEEPPLEVVSVTGNPIESPGEISQPGDLQPLPGVQTAPLVSPVNVGSKPAQVEPATAQAEEKRGFFQRMNPVNLFRREKAVPPAAPARPPQEITPLQKDAAAAVQRPAPDSQPALLASDSSPQPDVTPIPSTTSGTRYQYRKIKKPVAGDRPAAERLFERGVGAQSRRDPGGAATFFASAVTADPTYFAAQYNLGLASYSAGQWFKALSAFETALVLEPNSAEGRYNFALTLQKASFPADAARELETLIAQQPDNGRSHLLLGNLYAQDLADTAKAREHYLKVLVLEPQHPQAAAIRSWLVAHP